MRNPGDLDPHNLEKMIDYGDAAPVTQRRLVAVTDDYVVIADCLQAPVAHTYDWLMHPIGFQGATSEAIRSVRHSDRLLDDPAGSYCHVTDCDWFEARAPLAHAFRDGPTRLTVHSVWPTSLSGAVGTFPFPTADVSWRIDGDGRHLADGGFVANHFDAHAIDVDVTGTSALRLTISLDLRDDVDLITHTLGDPRFVTDGGGTVHLADLPCTIAGNHGPIPDSEPTRPVLGAHQRQVDLAAAGHPVVVTIDTTSLGSARFVTNLAVEGLNRDMTNMRRTLLLRQRGSEARFLTVLEPFQDSAAIRQVRASGPDRVEVSLADGRMHSIEITGLEAGTDPRVSLREHRGGALIREETTA